MTGPSPAKGIWSWHNPQQTTGFAQLESRLSKPGMPIEIERRYMK
jgi:hypothetical protein